MQAHSLRHLLAFGLLFLSACGPVRAFPGPLPSPVTLWTITLTQTGGFAGVSLRIQVSSDGLMVAQDLRSGRTVTQAVPADTMSALNGLVAGIELSQKERLPSACADCFIYDLEIVTPNGTTRVRADDTTVSDSGAQALIQLLGKMRDQALQSAI
jgi:hypothetical protein